jgi:hypothetical protein
MSNLREVGLDDRGLDYLREHLEGVNTFCSELLAVVDRTPGETFTFAPADLRGERLYRFGEPGLPARALAELRAERILELLDADADACCIVDDFDARWGDAKLEDSPTAFGVGEEVYHLLTAESGAELIAEVIGQAGRAWHGVAAVCTPPPSDRPGEQSTLEALRTCARSVIEISCTAYDGEGFVAWRRR